jgi:hypothetical protein
MAATGASYFRDIKNCVYTPTGGTAIPIFDVKVISTTLSFEQIWCMTNDTLRPVGVSTVGINETVSITTDDMLALIKLRTSAGPGALTFFGIAVDHVTVGTNLLDDQNWTIANLVISAASITMPSKGLANGSVSGKTMEQSAGDEDSASQTSSSSTGGPLN